MKLDIGIKLPIDAVTDTFAVLAKRGAGKSYCASVLAEEMIAAGQRIVVIDPTDAWWGLRAKADGSPNGLPVVIFGGEHADLPLDENMGPVVADLIVDRKIDSCILCTKGFESDASRVRFLLYFGKRLFFRSREPLHLFLDECDDYLPQYVTGDKATLVGCWQKIVKQGRRQGLGVTLISQRAAVVHKDVLSQTETLVVLRTTSPQDIKAIQAWVRDKAGGEGQKAMLDSLPSLKNGEAWIYSPQFLEIDPPQKIQVRLRRTFDSGRTPKIGERKIEPKELAKVDLDALRESLASTIAKAQADDPKALRARILELEREVKRGAVAAPAAPPTIERVEVPILSDEDRADLRHFPVRLAELAEEYDRLVRSVDSKITFARQAPSPMPASRTPAREAPIRQPVVDATVNRIYREATRRATNGNGHLGGGETKMLTAIAQHGIDGCDREQLTVLTGYKRSSRDTYLQRLKAAGMIEEENGSFRARDAGLSELGDYESLPTGSALRDYWIARLPEGEKRILSLLLDYYPKGTSRSRIDDGTGYKRSSRDTYLQRLGARKLVVSSRDEVRASHILFDGARS